MGLEYDVLNQLWVTDYRFEWCVVEVVISDYFCLLLAACLEPMFVANSVHEVYVFMLTEKLCHGKQLWQYYSMKIVLRV